MVSRIIKRTPTKIIKDCRISHHNRRQKSPIKNVASRVVTSVNKSICTCHRRLIKIFSKLAQIGTPKSLPVKKATKSSKKLPAHDHQDMHRRRKALSVGRKTVFLDLNETLIHLTPEILQKKYDFVVQSIIDDQKVDFYMLKRPFLDEFLEILSKKLEIVVFIAGIEEYALLVLDRRNVISQRLYQDSCKEIDEKFVKDLPELGIFISPLEFLADGLSDIISVKCCLSWGYN